MSGRTKRGMSGAVCRLLFVLMLMSASPAAASLNTDRLEEEDIRRVQGLLDKLVTVVGPRQQKGTLATVTFEDLEAPLNKQEKKFLKKFRKLNTKKLHVAIPYRGMASGREKLVMIKGQKLKGGGEKKELPPQYLPFEVYASYMAMMEDMRRDIGKRLYVESGYRSSAYQLYLFLYYLKNHDYSIRETVKFVALPGYSEHGSPKRQAIDFINEDGINGEYNPKEFEDLPEYLWLLKNAHRFGFVLSYPRSPGGGITFEPWHWRFEGKTLEKKKAKPEKTADDRP